MKKQLLIEGMSCGHCVNHVKEALMELGGITSVAINLEAGTAIFEASEEMSDEAITFTIDEAGYKVIKIEVL